MNKKPESVLNSNLNIKKKKIRSKKGRFLNNSAVKAREYIKRLREVCKIVYV